MSPTDWLFAGGIFAAGFFVFHAAFWRLFRWDDELPRLGVLNRAIMPVLNLVLMFVFALVAWLSITQADAMTTTTLGRQLTGGIAAMWLFRAALQPLYFGLRHPGSVAFFVLFLLGGALYTIPLLQIARM